MATPGELVRKMAEVTALDAGAVSVIDRSLAKAGLRTMKGRGRGAAAMTPRDAAALLIACICANVSPYASDLVARIAALRAPHGFDMTDEDFPPELAPLGALGGEPSFLDTLEALIALAPQMVATRDPHPATPFPGAPPAWRVWIERPAFVAHVEAEFQDWHPYIEFREGDGPDSPTTYRRDGFDQRAIYALGRFIAGADRVEDNAA